MIRIKYNLKNRPDLEGLHAETLADAEQEIMECIDWFEGFEKELRERYSKITSEQDLSNLIEEILGDE